MIDKKIDDIIELLSIATKSGELIWIEITGNGSKRSYERQMTSKGEDGTIYDIEVKFILKNDKWIIEHNPGLWIKNKILPNGSFYVYGDKYKIPILRDLVRNKFCSDMNPSINIIESALSDISKGISLSTYRDNKINKIL